MRYGRFRLKSDFIWFIIMIGVLGMFILADQVLGIIVIPLITLLGFVANDWKLGEVL